jgi:DNA-binding MarR family transcriptional regulator
VPDRRKGKRSSPNGRQLDPSLVYVVGRVDQAVRREMRKRLAAWDLSVPEYTTLSVLRRRPGLSNAQLARRTMVTPQSMIQILARLEERELVRREVDPAHKRILRGEVTREGEELLAQADPAVNAIQDEMLRDVPDEQRAAVLDGMVKAMRRLSAGLNGGP